MSLYNTMNGVNPLAIYLIPMLGEKHPQEYPRFRDCFSGVLTNSKTDKDQFGIPKKVTSDEEVISVYTRVGGANRNSGFGEEELQAHPNFIRDFDDDFDSTFATYVFSVPEQFKDDYKKILDKNYRGISSELKDRMYKVFPLLKSLFDDIIFSD